MKLEPFKLPHEFRDWKGLVLFEVSNAVGMCRKKCMNCLCLKRINAVCKKLNITIPPYDKKEKHASPLFQLTERQLEHIRGELEKMPKPKKW